MRGLNEEGETAAVIKLPRSQMTPEELWADLRQGARNVAGVTWQVRASVHLLVLARAGDLPFASVTPEGFEDLDCSHLDGRQTMVQMKEVAGGDGSLTAAPVAVALDHAATSAPKSLIAVVTDGQLGSGLQFTGWDGFIAEQATEPVQDVVAALVRLGRSESDARSVIARARIVQLPWRLREHTERRVSEFYGAHPAVASFVVGRLYDELSMTAANQRVAALATAHSHPTSVVDTALADVQSAVDLSGLEAGVVAGVCGAADFLTTSGMSAGEFYAGVDGAPAHIAAQLDVPRLRELAELREAAGKERYALLVGPSGAGKSVLLWRAARDTVPGARVVRVHRVDTEDDVTLLTRHVRLLCPSRTSPVVVAADNLGRPGMRSWPRAASALLELADVVLLGACRAEDFHPSLLQGNTRIVEPRLDSEAAHAIAAGAKRAGVPLRMSAEEATGRADGLLMEFLALLTTGTHLEQTLRKQAAALGEPGRETQQDSARLITALHSVGLSLDADRLGEIVAPNAAPSVVGSALAVLKDEHILNHDGRTWLGLHELRSQTLARLLHESPPPTFGATLARATAALTPQQVGWLLRRTAENHPASMTQVARASSGLLQGHSVTAREAAELLEGAERADNAAYARTCRPILQTNLRPGLTVHQLAQFTYAVRNQGVKLSGTGVAKMDVAMQRVEEIAARLPPRSSAAAGAVATGLDGDRLRELLLSCELADATRLLEAVADLVPVTSELAAATLDRFAEPQRPTDAALWARLVQALSKHLEASVVPLALGTVEKRAEIIARADPLALDVKVNREAQSVTLTILLPLVPPSPDLPEWDSRPASRSDDTANEIAVAAANRLAAACPELETIEVVTVTASGTRYRTAGHEPGHKRMPRSAFPELVGVRRNVGYQAALRRLEASDSWSSILSEQIETANELTGLVAEALGRLVPNDNARRRRAWQHRVNVVRDRLIALSARPATTAVDVSQSHAQADDSERQADPVSETLREIALALPLARE